MEDPKLKRQDSPQVRRKSWPSAPRSILKKVHHPVPKNATIHSTSEDTESGLGSISTNSTSKSVNQNNQSLDEVIKVVSEDPVVNNLSSKSKVIQDESNSSNSAATVVSARTARKRRIAGIFQHYYPEGGWGYVILIVAFFSHFLASGVQIGFLILLPFASRRYQADQLEVGKLKSHISNSVVICGQIL